MRTADFCLLCGIAILSIQSALAQSTITVNPGTTYQTMTGWEVVDYAGDDLANFSSFIGPALDKLVNEVGIDRIRLEIFSSAENSVDYWSLYQAGSIPYAEWRCRRYSTVNDNSDAYTLNPSGFQFAQLDDKIDKIVLPMRQRLQARGEQLYINFNYVAFTAQMTDPGCPAGLQYHHDDSPQEYAEFMLAVFLHMQSKYGFVPNAVEVILEPDNTSFWRGKQIGDAIVATAQKLAANGFNPKFIAPSTTSASNAAPYFNTLASQAPQAVQYMSEISYHLYAGSTSDLDPLVNTAISRNLGLSMLEWWTNGNDYNNLHTHLTTYRNSAWQQGAIAGSTDDGAVLLLVNSSNANVQLGSVTRLTRHYYEFVRRGAVRVGAQSSNSGIKAVAFRNTNGRFVVVANMSPTGQFTIQGLPAGTYGVKYSSIYNTSQSNVSGPDVTIGANQDLVSSTPYSAVVTVYARTGGAPPDTTPPSAPANLGVQ